MKLCKYCGNSFVSKKHPNQKYCSVECRDNARKRRVIRYCENCGKQIERKKNRAAKFSHSFCCLDCSREYRKNNPISGIDHIQYKTRKRYHCDYCGQDIYRLPSRIKKYMFCSVECRLQWQRESGYTSGEKSATWLGGHKDGRGPNWTTQSRKARKRDGFKCMRCGVSQKQIGKALDVHHVNPWRNFNGDWKSANHIDNLITLCPSCHQIVEWESGSKASPSS